MSDTTSLPGEDRPLAPRIGGAPITDAEAWGVARRVARRFAETQGEGSKRRLSAMAEVEAWPESTRTTQASWRVPLALLWRVRARAEMEGRTVTSVLVEALDAYASGSPGSHPVYVRPRGRR